MRTCHVSANVVAGHDIVVGTGAADPDTVDGIPRDHVTLGAVRGAVAVGTDEVVLGPARNLHAVPCVWHGQCARRIGADVVAGHHVVVGADVLDADAVIGVSGDHVALVLVERVVAAVGAD